MCGSCPTDLFTKNLPGRRIATTPPKPWTRSLATEVDLEDVESSLDNSLRETRSIESQIQEKSIQIVPQIDARTHATQNLVDDGTDEAYEQHLERRRIYLPFGPLSML